MISGTPHGTISGLILFLLNINDISGNVKSKNELFVDDMKMYREIEDSIINTEILRSDLNLVSQYRLIISKCVLTPPKREVMRITHRRGKRQTASKIWEHMCTVIYLEEKRCHVASRHVTWK